MYNEHELHESHELASAVRIASIRIILTPKGLSVALRT